MCMPVGVVPRVAVEEEEPGPELAGMAEAAVPAAA